MRSRTRRILRLHPPERLFSRSVIANLFTLAFVAVDFATLYTMWNLYLLESPVVLYLLAGGFAAILDVPMAMAGNAFKQYRQGLRPKSEAWLVLILSVLAFLVVFVLSWLFRMETRDLAFGSGQTGGLVSMSGELLPAASDENDRAQFLAALALAFLPLATSLSAFAVTFLAADPLEEKRLRLELQRAELQAQIAALEGVLAELETPEAFLARRESEEEAACQRFFAKIDAQVLVLKQKARLLLMESQGKPEDIAVLTGSGRALMKEAIP